MKEIFCLLYLAFLLGACEWTKPAKPKKCLTYYVSEGFYAREECK